MAELDDAIRTGGFALNTRALKSAGLRYVLRWLWEYHGAPKLDDCVRRYSGIRPRNVTITQEEHRALIDAAPKHVKLWLHLCSDLAMRSGTAAKIAPHNYDPATGLLKFTTKYNERLTLPVTQEIADLFAQCDQKNSASFVRQLWQRKSGQQGRAPGELTLHHTSLSAAFRKACKAARIHRNIRPHDLRRTTAVAMLEATHDVRDVQAVLGHRNLQSTIWYLDHDLRPVKKDTLELIKLPAWRKEQTA